MDSIAVDLGTTPRLVQGQRAIVLGRDGEEQIRAEELARRVDMINYEITCGLSSRLPRVYHHDDRE